MLGRKVDMVLFHAQGAEGQERKQTQSTGCTATDEDEIITYPATNEEIARKKPLVYYNGAAKERVRPTASCTNIGSLDQMRSLTWPALRPTPRPTKGYAFICSLYLLHVILINSSCFTRFNYRYRSFN